VKWLFAAANAPLPLGATEVLNMRNQSADEVLSSLFSAELRPNLPEGKVTASDAPSPANPTPANPTPANPTPANTTPADSTPSVSTASDPTPTQP